MAFRLQDAGAGWVLADGRTGAAFPLIFPG
jgi:hypothetical protein